MTRPFLITAAGSALGRSGQRDEAQPDPGAGRLLASGEAQSFLAWPPTSRRRPVPAGAAGLAAHEHP